MDLEAFHRSIYNLVVLIGATITSTINPTQTSLPIQTFKDPSILESYNIPLENSEVQGPEVEYQLSAVEEEKGKDKDLEMIVVKPSKEATPSVLVTVEKPKPTKKTVIAKASEKPLADEKKASEADEKKSIPTVLGSTLSSNAQKLFEMVNSHRAKLGLVAFEKDERLCQIAEDRAPQIEGEVFGSQALHQGFKALNLAYWATENIAAYSTIEQNFNFWIRDYIHKKAIEGNSKYSCVACIGSFCSQIFTSFVPK